MIVVLAAVFGISVALQNTFSIEEHITTVFVFAVFIISILTDGYIYGIISTVISVLGINFAFTFPYFAFNFTIPENALSAIVMVIISLITSALTIQIKRWETLKAEGDKEKMRANLLRAVSHDIRTPLTTIYGSSSAILENYGTLTDEQKRNLIDGIKQDSEWLVRIVENLLSVTKLDGGNIKLIKTPTMLDELIDSVFIKFKKRYPSQEVILDLPDGNVFILIDAILMEQVLVNILENAVQHAKGMTELKLKVFVISGKAIFEISDNGCGIEKDKLSRLFTGQIIHDESETDNQKRNAGIGLSVCASIIKAHGSRIYAENLKTGGALFCFELDTEEMDNEQ
ncbi:MAG: DUF4118 domain-containing protein [Oscillospiraceae bacterium]|nr:DUF4118 domain-containing protein [Oscillospiraceae bacterium]